MPATNPLGDTMIIGSLNPVEGKVVSVPSHDVINEKLHLGSDHDNEEDAMDFKHSEKEARVGTEINAVPAAPLYEEDHPERDNDSESDDDIIIDTAALAARHLLPLRDDRQPALSFRSIFLASGLSCFQAVMSQIYQVS